MLTYKMLDQILHSYNRLEQTYLAVPGERIRCPRPLRSRGRLCRLLFQLPVIPSGMRRIRI